MLEGRSGFETREANETTGITVPEIKPEGKWSKDGVKDVWDETIGKSIMGEAYVGEDCDSGESGDGDNEHLGEDEPQKKSGTNKIESLWNDIISEAIGTNEKVDTQETDTEDAGNVQTFSSLDEMKEKMDASYKEIKARKPKNSPNLAKWFEKGGKLEIYSKDGKEVWTYVNPEGIKVSYVEGYPVFPPEAKHPYIGDINIGVFTGDREKDKEMYLKILEEEYGLTQIPEGYALHHDAENGNMQLVKEEYHKEFTHAGGHSKFKEDSEEC